MHTIYKHSTSHPLTHLQFRERLVNELLNGPEKKSRKQSREDTSTQEEQHYWASVCSVGELYMCTRRNKSAMHRKQTRQGCVACNVHYCSFDCFSPIEKCSITFQSIFLKIILLYIINLC
jgi:hypothetical protein